MRLIDPTDGSRSSRALKRCCYCRERKPLTEFKAYAYTTRQGRRSVRNESRCTPCTRTYRMARRDRVAEIEACKAYRAARPDHAATYARAYRQTEEGRQNKAKAQRLRKARQRSGEGDNAAIRAIYAEAMRVEQVTANCPVFDLRELGHKMHVDHDIPLSRGGRHHEGNLQILPIGLNMRKGVRCA